MMKDKGNTLGIFHRAFPVQLPEEPIRFMTAQVKNVTDIDRLRYQKWLSKSESSVFTLGETAFGYGTGMEKFVDDGFSETRLVLKDSPRLAEGMIIEGLVDDARTRGRHYFGIYRNCCKMIRDEDYAIRNGFIIRVGYDLTAVNWVFEDEIQFGLIIEPGWTIWRSDGKAASSSAQIERELLKIHGVESAEDYTKSFVDSHHEFLLPCGGKARLERTAVKIFVEEAE